MIIACPHCQAALNLPEEVAGQQVRCPTCRQTFQGGAQTATEAKITTAPPPPPLRSPRDEPPPPRRRERIDDDFDRRGQDEEERQIIEENARQVAIFPAWAMLIAAGVTVADLLLGWAIGLLRGVDQGGANNPEVFVTHVIGIICTGVIFLPLVIFAFFGGRHLLRVESRGMVITGIVMEFIVTLLYVLAILLSLFTLGLQIFPVDPATEVPQLVVSCVACLLNFAAAILGTRALMDRNLQRHYALQQEELLRRRRY